MKKSCDIIYQTKYVYGDQKYAYIFNQVYMIPLSSNWNIKNTSTKNTRAIVSNCQSKSVYAQEQQQQKHIGTNWRILHSYLQTELIVLLQIVMLAIWINMHFL